MLVKKKVSVGCDIEFVELLRYKYTIELASCADVNPGLFSRGEPALWRYHGNIRGAV